LSGVGGRNWEGHGSDPSTIPINSWLFNIGMIVKDHVM